MAKTIRYFISGHRDLSQEEFDKYYVPAIENAVHGELGYDFVVGDCDGVDFMAQKYLLSKGYCFTVYHMFEKPRNFVLPDIPQDELDVYGIALKGGYTSDVERDSAMTRDSHVDIAFIHEGRWTSGTAQNILRRHEIKRGI